MKVIWNCLYPYWEEDLCESYAIEYLIYLLSIKEFTNLTICLFIDINILPFCQFDIKEQVEKMRLIEIDCK